MKAMNRNHILLDQMDIVITFISLLLVLILLITGNLELDLLEVKKKQKTVYVVLKKEQVKILRKIKTVKKVEIK